jgi:hypothetical protein
MGLCNVAEGIDGEAGFVSLVVGCGGAVVFLVVGVGGGAF